MGKKIVPNKVDEEVYEKLVKRAEKEDKSVTSLASELLEESVKEAFLDELTTERLKRFADDQRMTPSRSVNVLIDFYYDHDEEEEDMVRKLGLNKTAVLFEKYKYPVAVAQRAVEQINESIKSAGNYNPRKDSEW